MQGFKEEAGFKHHKRKERGRGKPRRSRLNQIKKRLILCNIGNARLRRCAELVGDYFSDKRVVLVCLVFVLDKTLKMLLVIYVFSVGELLLN